MCSGAFLQRVEKLSEPISATATLIKTFTVYYCESCGLVAEKFVTSTEKVEVEVEEINVESP